jgi:hypothetical protein
MKKSILFLISICLIFGNPSNAQVNRLINKVTKSVSGEKSPKPEATAKSTNNDPEPKCACKQPELIVDLGGKLKLMYTELTLTIRDDGAILAKDRLSDAYYIVKDGVFDGPLKAGDPKLAGFDNITDSNSSKTTSTLWSNNEFISKSGEKFLIKFNGESYGPYGEIRQFKVTKSKDKFAAIVVPSGPLVTETDAKKWEEKIKNAKTDQEKMDLSMQYSQEMAQKMQAGGGVMNTMPKLITNITGANFDPMRAAGGGMLNNSIKYDDILLKSYDKVTDLSSKVLIAVKPDALSASDLFINSANTKYAWYNYGTLTFGDGTIMSDLFNPHLLKTNGQVNLAYMYYSPGKNSIMQCKIPF